MEGQILGLKQEIVKKDQRLRENVKSILRLEGRNKRMEQEALKPLRPPDAASTQNENSDNIQASSIPDSVEPASLIPIRLPLLSQLLLLGRTLPLRRNRSMIMISFMTCHLKGEMKKKELDYYMMLGVCLFRNLPNT